jgi:hypothetical protein
VNFAAITLCVASQLEITKVSERIFRYRFSPEIFGYTFVHLGNKGKGKAKVVPLLPPEHHAMKAYWRVEVELHQFLDPGTRRR